MHPANREFPPLLLRGAGTALALPLLDAMIPPFTRAAAVQAAIPTRGISLRTQRHLYGGMDAEDRRRCRRVGAAGNSAPNHKRHCSLPE